jgi:hypothetical protein
LLLYPTSVTSNAGNYTDFPCPGVWARPAGFTNLSKVAITGDWLKWNPTSANWEGYTGDSNWHVYMDGIDLTKEAHTDAGTGTRIVTKTLGGMQAMLNLRLQLDPSSPGEFQIGSTITSGTVNATDGTGVVVTLIPGQYYSIEGTGGPWRANSTTFPNPLWTIAIFKSIIDFVTIGFDENSNTWSEYGGLAYEHLTENKYGRAYFMATDTTYNIRVLDNEYNDNIGTMGYILRNASYQELYKWNIRGVSLYNICSA